MSADKRNLGGWTYAQLEFEGITIAVDEPGLPAAKIFLPAEVMWNLFRYVDEFIPVRGYLKPELDSSPTTDAPADGTVESTERE
jgi:hypothetical protein